MTETFSAATDWLDRVTVSKESEGNLKSEAFTLRREFAAAQDRIFSLKMTTAVTSSAPNAETVKKLSESKENGTVLALEMTKLTKKIEELRL